jgi:hypothetical protein
MDSHQGKDAQMHKDAHPCPVVSGFNTPERANTAPPSVHGRPNTSKDIKLRTPRHDGDDFDMGGLTFYPRGEGE